MRIDIDHLAVPEPEAVLLLRNEVRRLEGVIAASQPVLTDAEREAVEWFANWGWRPDGVPGRNAATLRGLLERTKGGE